MSRDSSTLSIKPPKTIHWTIIAADTYMVQRSRANCHRAAAIDPQPEGIFLHADRWRQVSVLRPERRQGRPGWPRRPRQVVHRDHLRLRCRQVENRVLL